ncbi:MAG: peptidoglycan D,D-transpeptidase FtsI family protein [Acutalibacteraceae bacterium]
MRTLAKYSPKGVMCMAMDPKTGEILAMCNKESYDLNNPPRDDTAKLNELSRNRLLADANDPGSIFKVFTMAAALNENQTQESETFTCTGGIEVQGKTIRCTSSHGTIDLKTGLAKSCNPVFVRLALRLGTDTMYTYLDKFGFGQKTGVDMAAEARGIVIKKENVKEGDLARIGFGQSISTTPIQTLNAFCAVINGGELLEPHVMKTVKDADGNIIEEKKKTVKANPITADTSRRIREMLVSVVGEGSGKNSYVKGYSIGGKTGTAQKYDENGKVKEKHLSSFIAFAPADDPQIAILFMVDEANVYNDYGGTVAAPYVGQILEETLKYMCGTKADGGRKENESRWAGGGGMTERTPETLEAQGYQVVNGTGIVSRTLRPAQLQRGKVVSPFRPPRLRLVLTKVPALVGKPRRNAKAFGGRRADRLFPARAKRTWQTKSG